MKSVGRQGVRTPIFVADDIWHLLFKFCMATKSHLLMV